MRKFSLKGQMIVELILALGLSAIFIPVVLSGFLSLPRENIEQRKIRALGLLLEAKEAVRLARERDWRQVAANGTYHPEIHRDSWELIPGQETIEEFVRKIEISDIVSGGEVDPSIKKIDFSVSWDKPFSSQVSSTTYLSRYLGNQVYVQTASIGFYLGKFDNVEIVVSARGGEIVLKKVCGEFFSTGPTPTPGFKLCRLPYKCQPESVCEEIEADAEGADCDRFASPPETCCKCEDGDLVYAPEGVFESSIYDAHRDVAFNRIVLTTDKPPNTDIKYQISIKQGQGGSCAGVTPVFVGPDKREDSFFEDSSPIPFGSSGDNFQNPGQCFAYRVYFTSDGARTPVFREIRVNWSP